MSNLNKTLTPSNHVYPWTSLCEGGQRHSGQLEIDQFDLVEPYTHDLFPVGINIKSEENVETREPEILKTAPAGWDIAAAFVSVLGQNLHACDNDFIGHGIIFNVWILCFNAFSSCPLCMCSHNFDSQIMPYVRASLTLHNFVAFNMHNNNQ